MWYIIVAFVAFILGALFASGGEYDDDTEGRS